MKTLAEITAYADRAADAWYADYRAVELYNQKKVLDAFRSKRIGYHHFAPSSGYGMGDAGRDTLEELWSEIFRAEASLIRQQIVSGTHAITLSLFGVLRPGDELVILGTPYDTLFKVLGRTEADACSLRELGVSVKIMPLGDPARVGDYVSPGTKMFYIQRSKGYEYRPALTIDEIAAYTAAVKAIDPQIVVFVDNCYGEFVEEREPLEVGADLMAGSLIKNAGGTIAPAGGYICGCAELVERAAFRLTAPGIGAELGPSLIGNGPIYQGVFMAPHIVSEALKGAVYIAAAFSAMGYDVLPKLGEQRGDIVQAICFDDKEKLKAFCRGVQRFSPVDSHVYLEDWDMPGYEDKVIMASGGFVQGSSIELSADGPMRPPYIAYVQGGISLPFIKTVIDGIIREDYHIE